jgi:hypothetical protein
VFGCKHRSPQTTPISEFRALLGSLLSEVIEFERWAEIKNKIQIENCGHSLFVEISGQHEAVVYGASLVTIFFQDDHLCWKLKFII